MKTPIQEIQEAFSYKNKEDFFTWFYDNKERLFALEEKIIIDSATHGANFDTSPYSSAHEYFKKTFNNN